VPHVRRSPRPHSSAAPVSGAFDGRKKSVKLTWPVLSFQLEGCGTKLWYWRRRGRPASARRGGAGDRRRRARYLIITAGKALPPGLGREKLERETGRSGVGEGGSGGQASGRCQGGWRPAQAPSRGHIGGEVVRREGTTQGRKKNKLFSPLINGSGG
jgi:hypothetical protein